jgi:Restriction endonuclease BamHI
VKIVHVETILSCGSYAASENWAETRAAIHAAVKRCAWPPGSKKFTIYPQSGKKRGEGNGVVPIRAEFIKKLRKLKWTIEGAAKNHLGQELGDFDAILLGPEGPIVVEWETGNISSSHRSMNKLTMLVSNGIIAAGTLVVPSRKLYVYLTDRIGNYKELEPYLKLWKSVPCKSGVLEIVVIEQDAESYDVPKIPKGSDGRAKG